MGNKHASSEKQSCEPAPTEEETRAKRVQDEKRRVSNWHKLGYRHSLIQLDVPRRADNNPTEDIPTPLYSNSDGQHGVAARPTNGQAPAHGGQDRRSKLEQEEGVGRAAAARPMPREEAASLKVERVPKREALQTPEVEEVQAIPSVALESQCRQGGPPERPTGVGRTPTGCNAPKLEHPPPAPSAAAYAHPPVPAAGAGAGAWPQREQSHAGVGGDIERQGGANASGPSLTAADRAEGARHPHQLHQTHSGAVSMAGAHMLLDSTRGNHGAGGGTAGGVEGAATARRVRKRQEPNGNACVDDGRVNPRKRHRATVPSEAVGEGWRVAQTMAAAAGAMASVAPAGGLLHPLSSPWPTSARERTGAAAQAGCGTGQCASGGAPFGMLAPRNLSGSDLSAWWRCVMQPTTGLGGGLVRVEVSQHQKLGMNIKYSEEMELVTIKRFDRGLAKDPSTGQPDPNSMGPVEATGVVGLGDALVSVNDTALKGVGWHDCLAAIRAGSGGASSENPLELFFRKAETESAGTADAHPGRQ